MWYLKPREFIPITIAVILFTKNGNFGKKITNGKNRGIQTSHILYWLTLDWPWNDPKMTYLAMTMTTTTIRYVFHCQFLFWGDRIEPELIFCSVKYLKLKTLFLTESGLIPIQIKTSSFSRTTFWSSYLMTDKLSVIRMDEFSSNGSRSK